MVKPDHLLLRLPPHLHGHGVRHKEGNVKGALLKHHVAKVDEGTAAGEAAVVEHVLDVRVAVRQREGGREEVVEYVLVVPA